MDSIYFSCGNANIKKQKRNYLRQICKKPNDDEKKAGVARLFCRGDSCFLFSRQILKESGFLLPQKFLSHKIQEFRKFFCILLSFGFYNPFFFFLFFQRTDLRQIGNRQLFFPLCILQCFSGATHRMPYIGNDMRHMRNHVLICLWYRKSPRHVFQ